MRRRVQISFLSVFLTLLTVAFATAVMVRVRSYTVKTATESSSPTTAAATASATSRPAGARATFEPLPDDRTTAMTSSPAPAKTSTQAAMTRAQRFRELLAAGISAIAPSAAPAAAQQLIPQPKPPAPQPKAAAAPQRQLAQNGMRPQGNSAGPSSGGNGQSGSGNDKPKTPADPKDPNSDTVPPQLISIAFDPPQVQDGGDTTLVINATDDLSGIRGISGTLTSPNGKAVQGFAQQREGETMRYTSRIHIPEKAEEGMWKVSFLTMSDMATNSVTLSAAQGTLPPTAMLKVISAASDSTAPTLRNVWLDRRAMRAGEHNTLYVDASDEKSGIHLVAAVFLSPSKVARIGVGCQKGANDVYQCDVMPPTCLDCGDWTLEQVQMQDNASNFATIRSENPAVAAIRLNIAGDSCDNTPPVLQGLQLNRTEIFMGRDEPVIEVTAQVSDDSCGVGGVSGQLVGPGTSSNGTFFSFTQREGNIFVGTIRLHPNSARGVWRIQSITVNDRGQNLKTYYGNDPLLGRAQFTVR